MELQVGFHLKLLQPVEEGSVFIPKGDVVEVVNLGKHGEITVKDILDETVTLPRGIKYRLARTRPVKKAAKITAAPIDKPYQPKIRSIQLAQVATSNALVSDDPIEVAKLALAASILAMSLQPGLDMNQYSRLNAYASRLINS